MKYWLLIILLLIGACSVSPDQNPVQTPETPKTPQPQASSLCITTLTSESVNIRKAASVTSGIVGILKAEELKPVVSTAGQWYQVQVGSADGYIANWVVQKTPCSTEMTSSSNCFTKVSDSPEIFVKGLFEWGRGYITPEKIPQLYQVILKHYQTDKQAKKLYVEITSDQRELFRVFPDIDDRAGGVEGLAVLSSDSCNLLAKKTSDQPGVRAIVAWALPDITQLGENVEVIVHELSHAAGAEHGGNTWMNDAYFWGYVGRRASYENTCKEFDEPEKTICNEFHEVMVTNTEIAG